MSQRFYLASDDDGHWYVVPAEKRTEWEGWIYSDAYMNGDVPEWAKAVNKSPGWVTFENWEIE